MKRALLVRFGGLGDLLVTLPSIRYLRAKFPEAKLSLVCRREYGRLFLEAGVVDEIIAEDSRRLLPLFRADVSSGRDSAAWLESFDSVMVWTQESPVSFLRKAPGLQEGSERPRIIRADPRGKEQLSRAFFLKTAESVGETDIPSLDEWSRLPSENFSNNAGPRIVVHPGSGSEAKRWPLRNFMKIIEEMAEKGMEGALVTGEAEEDLASAIAAQGLPLNWEWIRRPSILCLAGILGGARLYLGNDSGVTHLAAALGAKVIALFRDENVFAWRPLGRVHLLSAASPGDIEMEFVKKNIVCRNRK